MSSAAESSTPPPFSRHHVCMETWQTVTLYGGPLDGERAEVDLADPDPGTALASPHSAYGPGGRSWYEPDADGVWRWVRDTP